MGHRFGLMLKKLLIAVVAVVVLVVGGTYVYIPVSYTHLTLPTNREV